MLTIVNTVLPRYSWGVGSRTRSRYQHLQTHKPHICPSVYASFASTIQATVDCKHSTRSVSGWIRGCRTVDAGRGHAYYPRTLATALSTHPVHPCWLKSKRVRPATGVHPPNVPQGQPSISSRWGLEDKPGFLEPGV